jgi:hypothetical protein
MVGAADLSWLSDLGYTTADGPDLAQANLRPSISIFSDVRLGKLLEGRTVLPGARHSCQTTLESTRLVDATR